MKIMARLLVCHCVASYVWWPLSIVFFVLTTRNGIHSDDPPVRIVATIAAAPLTLHFGIIWSAVLVLRMLGMGSYTFCFIWFLLQRLVLFGRSGKAVNGEN